MQPQTTTKAHRHFLKRIAPAIAFHICILLLAQWLVDHYHPAGSLALLLAILATIPVLFVLLSIGLYLKEETDEFERSVVVQSQLLAIAATLAITTFWGILQLFHIAPALPPFRVGAIYWICAGLATPIIRLRYR